MSNEPARQSALFPGQEDIPAIKNTNRMLRGLFTMVIGAMVITVLSSLGNSAATYLIGGVVIAFGLASFLAGL